MCALKLPIDAQSTPPKADLQQTSMVNLQQGREPGNTLRRWLWLNSFGGRLFWMIMLSVLVGMGGMAFLFSEILRRQAEDQVRSSIDSKVNAISSVTESAETLAYSLGVSVVTLNERRAQYPDTYRELVLQLFEERPNFVMGLGLGQGEYGIIEDQPWLFPYYSEGDVSDTTDSGQEGIRYEDFADDEGEFYPESKRYQDYFLLKRSIWTEPYATKDTRLLTYYYPLFNQDGRWLGTTLVDIDTAYLGNLLDDTVFQQAGKFLLVTRSGSLIADPANSSANIQTYEDFADLKLIWGQLDKEKSGFLRGEIGYWAYSTVPGQDWLLFGFVPYEAIFGRIIRIAVLTTGLVGLLLTVMVYLAIRKLNQRIKPILLQANQFAHANQTMIASSTQHDELEQLSLSFFNLLNQLNLHQEMIRRHEETIAQSNLHVDQITEKFLAFTTQIDDETREQQDLIQKVRQQLHEHIDEYQDVDNRLDALFNLAQTLEGFLESLPSEAESVKLFDALDQRIFALTAILDHAHQPIDKTQSQSLITQLMTDVAHLKAYDRQHHSLEKLGNQTSSLNQTKQATLAKSQAMVTAAQAIIQILTEIETITKTLNHDAQQVADMLWGNLQQSDVIVLQEPQEPKFSNVDKKEQLTSDRLILNSENSENSEKEGIPTNIDEDDIRELDLIITREIQKTNPEA